MVATQHWGCPISSFPQNYLGLPLSSHKLKLSAFRPIIDKVDRRLAGWKGKLLSIGGRSILVRVVLRSLPSYAMGAILLPAGTIQEIDKRCRAFFWTGEDHANGGNCKVAWDEVCAPMEKGGLGFRCLRTHNSCLLLKHLAKLHSPSAAPWEQRFASTYGWSDRRDLGDSHPMDSPVWKDLLAGLDLFRSLTKVTIGDGLATSFWLDLWLGDVPLASRFPAQF